MLVLLSFPTSTATFCYSVRFQDLANIWDNNFTYIYNHSNAYEADQNQPFVPSVTHNGGKLLDQSYNILYKYKNMLKVKKSNKSVILINVI